MRLDKGTIKKKKKKGRKPLPLHEEDELEWMDTENRQVKKLVWHTNSGLEDHYRGLLRLEDNTTKDVC